MQRIDPARKQRTGTRDEWTWIHRDRNDPMSREEVIQRVVEREKRHLTLIEEAVLQHDAELHRAACDHFGTWETVLQYAGVNLKRVAQERRYSPERIKHELRRLCCSGYKVSAVRIMRRNRGLYDGALQHFGSWREALRAAGINPDHIRRQTRRIKNLDKPQVAKILVDRMQRGLPLRWKDVCCEDYAFAQTAKMMFGSWRNALIAAGFTPQLGKGNPKWSRNRVVVALRTRQQMGLPTGAVWSDDAPLASAAVRYFDSLHNALAAAGLDTESKTP